MAEGFRYVCGHCQRSVEAWSDGNPYYLDAAGAKHYAYHPDHENLARCVGNDSPHLCLNCGEETLVDSRQPRTECPACGTGKLVDVCELEGKACPFCKGGQFALDPRFTAIS